MYEILPPGNFEICSDKAAQTLKKLRREQQNISLENIRKSV